jgi:uncharacterized protein (DUF1697 family)
VTLYFALLRAVNLPGYKQVGMTDLRELLEALGLADVRSLLQSGNLAFRGKARASVSLERMLEAEAAKRLALETDFFVRSAEEWTEVIADNPFPREAERDPGRLIVFFLKGTTGAEHVKALQAAIKGPEIVRGEGRQAYIVYPDGIGRSRLTAALIEKKLGTRGTGRNWNTVLKLDALAG